jgi:superfamily II DNA/RNA helicase
MSLKQYRLSNLRSQIRETDFEKSYQKMLRNEVLSDNDQNIILMIAAILLSFDDSALTRFGYAIILRFANVSHEYAPLYDIALAHNYMPIAHLLEANNLVNTQETLSDLLLSSYTESYKDIKGIYRSHGQLHLKRFADANNNIAIIAPTSYGKSEMLIEKIEGNIENNICILVPTKALVAQTKRKVLQARDYSGRRIITHPDMYVARRDANRPFVAVLTQERLLRLFTKNKDLSLDILFIDEAHNLLSKDARSLIIAQNMLIAKKRNPYVDISFFTPFLKSENSVVVIGNDIPLTQSIDEHMKIERFYYRDFEEKSVYQYDQFTDKKLYSHHSNATDSVEFVIEQAIDKNVIYLNRPKDVERFAVQLMSNSSENILDYSPEIKAAINAIRDYTHPSYSLITAIQKSVVYHHGSMPDIIKMYVEELYSSMPIKYLVTTSTLLEGINIPANRLFIANHGKGRGVLNESEFTNLVGRVGRFGDVFNNSTGSPQLLEPRVYILKDKKYARKKLNPLNYYRSRVKIGLKIVDKVENPLLVKSTNFENRQSEINYIANIEEALPILEDGMNIEYATTEVGKLCFAYSIRDFPILANEDLLTTRIATYMNGEDFSPINDASELISAIKNIFLKDIIGEDNDTIGRLVFIDNLDKHYAISMELFTKYGSYNFMINRVMRYWEKLDRPVYVGKMGETDKDNDPNVWQKRYVVLKDKSMAEKVSFAVAIIKEDQDFIDTYVSPYLDIMNDLSMIDESFYNKVKYHTDSPEIVALIKYGLSFELAKLLASDAYKDLVTIQDIDVDYNKDSVLERMIAHEANPISIFEAKNYL